MRSRFGPQRVLIFALVLALAQLACNFGALPSTAIPLPPLSTLPPATLPPPTSAPPTTLPPTGLPSATQTPSAATGKYGTPDQAQAMLKKAVEHYNAVGRTQALADFNAEVAPFVDRDLYVACIDSTLTLSANGGYPSYVGGKLQPLSRAVWDAASTSQIGSINYSWLDPVTKTALPKSFYYEKVGTDVCGVGAYHP